jgi:hypothetical protein
MIREHCRKYYKYLIYAEQKESRLKVTGSLFYAVFFVEK